MPIQAKAAATHEQNATTTKGATPAIAAGRIATEKSSDTKAQKPATAPSEE